MTAFSAVLWAAAGLFAASGVLLVLAVARYGDFVLHPDAWLLVGGAFVVSAVGTAGLLVDGPAAGVPVARGALVVAGVGHCLAGWTLVRSAAASRDATEPQVVDALADADGFDEAS